MRAPFNDSSLDTSFEIAASLLASPGRAAPGRSELSRGRLAAHPPGCAFPGESFMSSDRLLPIDLQRASFRRSLPTANRSPTRPVSGRATQQQAQAQRVARCLKTAAAAAVSSSDDRGSHLNRLAGHGTGGDVANHATILAPEANRVGGCMI